MLLERKTVKPLAPAGPSTVTVPDDEFPAATDVGLTVSVTNFVGVIVRTAFWVTLLRVAEMVDVVRMMTPDVETVNVALDCPG